MRSYRGLIDESDLVRNSELERDRAFLSRAVAATAIRRVTGYDHKMAAASVIDGSRDQGIDAVAVTEGNQVWLVQAKWHERGTAGFNTDAARALIDGLRLLEQREFGEFNERLKPFTPRLNSAFEDMALKITLVIALIGDDPLHSDTIKILDRARDDHFGHGPMLDYRLIGASEILRQMKDDRSPVPVNVNAYMSQWTMRNLPFPAYLGTVAASSVAQWYTEYGARLYSENIRESLGVTRINSGIQSTLTDEPENFWYFNNGITILCDEIEPHWPGPRRPDCPVDLELKNVSVVNGAQTVTAIYEAMQSTPATAELADVSVRVISLGGERTKYAARITETTNTQNDVSQRDFIALDDSQAILREDFDLSLQKLYVYKRGEADPAPDSGCSVEHAAIALACAYRTSDLSVRAKRDTKMLWERGRSGAYPKLFGERPSALRVWRSVCIHRAVGDSLSGLRERLSGRAADIARRGDLLIAHMIFQLIDQEDIDEPVFDLDSILAAIPVHAELVLTWLIHHLDEAYGTGSFLNSTFANEGKCRDLVRLVLADVRRGSIVPKLPDSYQPSAGKARKARRPNTVPTLVSSGLLRDGTPIRYIPQSVPEKTAVRAWLDADPRRAHAAWVNDRVKPLIWAYDGGAYSAGGLLRRMWEVAGWEEAPTAIQGPSRFTADGKRSLYEMAIEYLTAQDEDG